MHLTPDTETSEDFKSYILCTIKNDTTGVFCKTDSTILTIGYCVIQKLRKK